HAAVGSVTESDVMMCAASEGAIVIAFHVPVSNDVTKTAEREGISIREHTILYAMIDEVENLLLGLLEAVETETILGHLEVKAVFLRKKNEQIIGGRVTDGIMKRLPFRLTRPSSGSGQVSATDTSSEQTVMGRITSLKHIDKDIREA